MCNGAKLPPWLPLLRVHAAPTDTLFLALPARYRPRPVLQATEDGKPITEARYTKRDAQQPLVVT